MKNELLIEKPGVLQFVNQVDCIVNAANEGLWAGGGVCGAIFDAAGKVKLQAECNAIGHCETGKAVITSGCDLPVKYIIHAVGPQGENPVKLGQAYWNTLELARENDVHSIAIPGISMGIFGYPKKAAAKTAVKKIRQWIEEHEDYGMKIIIACHSDEVYQAFVEAEKKS